MDTRYSKRGGKAVENNEANPKLLQAVEEDLAQECEEVPIQPKKANEIFPEKNNTSSVAVSPTGALELAKLKEQTKMDRQKIEHLEERINYLEGANRDLKADKTSYFPKIKEAPSTPSSAGKVWDLSFQILTQCILGSKRFEVWCKNSNLFRIDDETPVTNKKEWVRTAPLQLRKHQAQRLLTTLMENFTFSPMQQHTDMTSTSKTKGPKQSQR
ncbi:hypothetical protein F2P81_007574 [Scophthalmus maximus]|uniref:BEN domain-containing protein n=1 Tax=Scophthalmus maximus TaxID=52904 RepID=A0A6A4T399_SCOMX|nr:hypothetical protein F2P81_007574 [Scophthalmus maximus]